MVGHLVENAVGAHLVNHLQGLGYEVSGGARSTPGRLRGRGGRGVWAIEVKSGRQRSAPGLEMFRKRHAKSRTLLVGPGGLALEEFFLADPAELLRPP
jgi:hypothetical protein